MLLVTCGPRSLGWEPLIQVSKQLNDRRDLINCHKHDRFNIISFLFKKVLCYNSKSPNEILAPDCLTFSCVQESDNLESVG